ncbi:MAG: hypothetical protein M3Y31_06645, partial [Gemmatimonadota bacterium]|nr:hypothetical protein [Gemmatimonadota bacterium]
MLLHRVGQDAQGAVDSLHSGPAGEFAVRFPADTSALFLLSARYAGLEYFSLPLPVDPARPDTAVRIVVADTSAAQPVNVVVRQLVIMRPEPDGTREVLDLIELENAGPFTRVGRDTLSPSWAMPLPSGVIDFHAGPGDGALEAIERQGDALTLLAPIPPGPKQLLVQYSIPAGSTTLPIPVTDSIERFEVLLEEARAGVTSPGVSRGESRDVEGRTFHLWSGAPAAGNVVIELPDTAAPARWTLLALVAAVAVGLAAAGWYVMRRRSTVPLAAGPEGGRTVGAADDPVALADAAAELDVRYAGREAEVSPQEWREYQEERARLKSA